jgi:hypothetical protein
MATSDMFSDEVFADPELEKVHQFTIRASEIQGATANYLGAMMTWLPGFVEPCSTGQLSLRAY